MGSVNTNLIFKCYLGLGFATHRLICRILDSKLLADRSACINAATILKLTTSWKVNFNPKYYNRNGIKKNGQSKSKIQYTFTQKKAIYCLGNFWNELPYGTLAT